MSNDVQPASATLEQSVEMEHPVSKTFHDNQTSGAITTALYIVGCLGAAGLIPYVIGDSNGDLDQAVKIVAWAIEDCGLWKRGETFPNQPFLRR